MKIHGYEKSGVWHNSFCIHSYDVDLKRKLKPTSLQLFLQEAAWNHAEHLQLGYSQLASKKQFWVLSRFSLEMSSWPNWSDEIIISTWPRGADGLLALRDFEINSKEGTRLGGATSSWIVLDSETRKPQRADRVLSDIKLLPDKIALKRNARKIPKFDFDETNPMQSSVLYSCIDVNAHVNNSQYLTWILDCYSPEYHMLNSLHTVDINYLSEATYPANIKVYTAQMSANEHCHVIKKSDDLEVCRGVLTWIESQKQD